MDKQETPRQQKINRVLQQEIAKVLQQAVSEGSIKNLLVSVTKVRVTSDLSIAKIYLSIFPVNDAITYIDALKENRSQLRHDLAQRMKNQLRRFPELHFYLDDSLDYIEGINEELRNGTNPLINPESLDSRKKKINFSFSRWISFHLKSLCDTFFQKVAKL